MGMTLKILSLSAQTPSSPQPTPPFPPFVVDSHPPPPPPPLNVKSFPADQLESQRRGNQHFHLKSRNCNERKSSVPTCAVPRGAAHTCRGTITGPPTAAVSPLVTLQAFVFSLLECNERPLPDATSMETDLQPCHTCTHRTPSPWKNTNAVQGCSRGPAAPAKRPNNREDCV